MKRGPGSATRWMAALTLLAAAAVAPAHTSAQDAHRFLDWTVLDARDMTVRLLPLTPLVMATAGLALPVAEDVDRRLLEEIQGSYRGAWGDYLDVMNEMGAAHMWIPTTSLFAVSLLTDNEKFQDAAFTTVESLVASVAITATVKQVIGRPRPEEGRGAIRLRPFSGSVSFPSGHTTVAFAVVAPWIFYYPGPVTYSLLALSASTGIARIAKDKHWPTDILAGATVGILTGRWLSRRHQSRIVSGGVSIEPFMGLNSVGVAIRFQ